MNPIILLSQAKDLLKYLKETDKLNKESLLVINKKLLKMLVEVSENLEKIK